MSSFSGWHLVVLALLTVVPILVVAAIVVVTIRVRRSTRARSEECIAQRTAELLRSADPRRD
jgi:Tfp pilus assembly protein PilX